MMMMTYLNRDNITHNEAAIATVAPPSEYNRYNSKQSDLLTDNGRRPATKSKQKIKVVLGIAVVTCNVSVSQCYALKHRQA